MKKWRQAVQRLCTRPDFCIKNVANERIETGSSIHSGTRIHFHNEGTSQPGARLAFRLASKAGSPSPLSGSFGYSNWTANFESGFDLRLAAFCMASPMQ